MSVCVSKYKRHYESPELQLQCQIPIIMKQRSVPINQKYVKLQNTNAPRRETHFTQNVCCHCKRRNMKGKWKETGARGGNPEGTHATATHKTTLLIQIQDIL